MSKVLGLLLSAVSLGASWRTTASKDAPTHLLHSRSLLGNNFGVPTVNATYDYVIIGGGQAGLTVASRLSEDPTISVAVVEAGSFYEITNGNISQIPADDVYWTGKATDDFNPLIDWGFNTTPQAGAYNQVSHYARGRTLGGCSARNYMAYQRATVDSLQRWADEVGDQSWNYVNTDQYYKKSLNFTQPDETKRGANATPAYNFDSLNEGQPLDVTFSNYPQAFSTWVAKSLAALGLAPINGFTSGKLIGQSWLMATINHTTGERESSETAFLRPVLGRPNLSIYIDTLAKRITFNGTTATGVQVTTEDFPYYLTAKREVIVSAGAFQSPQLLMVSGIGPSSILQPLGLPVIADLPGVGRNMWDHAFFGPSYRVNVTTASSLSYGDGLFQANELFDTQQAGFLASPGGDYGAYEKLPLNYRSALSSKAQQALSTFPPDWPELEFLTAPAYFGYQQNSALEAPQDGYQYATLTAALVAPLSRGNVSISSPDTADAPLINPNWLLDSTDAEVAVAAYKRVREIMARPEIAPVLLGPEYFPGLNVSTDAQILDLVRKSFNTVFHATSTNKMGCANDTMAVVDATGKVYGGVEGLRVIDASVMPFLPPGLPQGTVYMVAEKLADAVKADQRAS